MPGPAAEAPHQDHRPGLRRHGTESPPHRPQPRRHHGTGGGCPPPPTRGPGDNSWIAYPLGPRPPPRPRRVAQVITLGSPIHSARVHPTVLAATELVRSNVRRAGGQRPPDCYPEAPP